jgi:hypothetical protein
VSEIQPHRITETDSEGRTVGTADVVPDGDDGEVLATVHLETGHRQPGAGQRLVDAVLETPEVGDAPKVTAVLPKGETEALQRVQERLPDVTEVRPAGASVIVEAEPADPTAP